MTYTETIDYLFTRLPMFSRVGSSAIKHGLSNTLELCEALGNPQQKIKCIHIAGTNGKGSVSHMLAAVLQTAGYKTGLYTSPHLSDFRERIKVNGSMADKQFVVSFTEKVKPLIEKLDPSFFEITVAMAFTYFAQEEVDVAVIETGLGGRLDSTNIITPELSVITNIGYDHMQLLGDTLEKIAYEKAGIIKQNIPVVIGETHPETKAVFEQTAAQKKSFISFADQQRQVVKREWIRNKLVAEVSDTLNNKTCQYELDLPGIYQTQNLLTLLEACAVLKERGWRTGSTNIKNALKQVQALTGLHGRWEIVHEDPLVVLDVAHNEDGIKQLVQQLAVTPHQHLHIVLGMVKDKDVDKVLSLLPKNASYYFTKAQIPRALPENELAGKAARLELNGKMFSTVHLALEAAVHKANPDDMILVCGSVFLVGEIDKNDVKQLTGTAGTGLDLPDIFLPDITD